MLPGMGKENEKGAGVEVAAAAGPPKVVGKVNAGVVVAVVAALDADAAAASLDFTGVALAAGATAAGEGAGGAAAFGAEAAADALPAVFTGVEPDTDTTGAGSMGGSCK